MAGVAARCGEFAYVPIGVSECRARFKAASGATSDNSPAA